MLLNTKRSCLNFWSEVLRNVDEQNEMRRIVQEYQRAEEGLSDDDEEESDSAERKAVAAVKVHNTR
jgi:hypothetical protein